MNKNPLVFFNPFTRFSSLKFLSNNFLVLLLISMIFVLGSCNDDDEDFSADIQKVVGTYNVVDTDEGVRTDTTPEGLAKLKSAFAMGETRDCHFRKTGKTQYRQ